jgi:hypothetical protein
LSITTTLVKRFKMGNGYAAVADIAFDDSYPTGGEALTIPGLTVIDEVLFPQISGYLFEYDRTNKKIKVYTPVGTASAHTHAVALDGGASAAPSATAALTVNQAIPLAGIQDDITASGTVYIGPADNAENENEDIAFIVPAAGKITGLYANLGTACGGSGEDTKKIDLTVRVNGEDSDITCSLAADAVSSSDVAHEAAVSAGNKVTDKCVAAASIAAADLNLSLLYQITAGTSEAPTATHTHGPGTLAASASASGGALSAAAASEVANEGNLEALTAVRIVAFGY